MIDVGIGVFGLSREAASPLPHQIAGMCQALSGSLENGIPGVGTMNHQIPAGGSGSFGEVGKVGNLVVRRRFRLFGVPR